MAKILTTILFTLSAGLASAQVQGVVSGYAIDPRGGFIRPVLGIPGATRLGGKLPLAAGIVEGAVRNGRAVVISDEQPPRVYIVRNLGAPTPQVTALDAPVPQASRVFLNASATVALLYSSESQLFQFVRGIDSTPRAAHPFPAAMLNGTFSAAAIADSKPCALLASADDTNSYIQRICEGVAQSITMVAQLPRVQISSISWFRMDLDALITDQAGDQVLLLPNLGQGSPPIVLAGSPEGISSPVAVLPLDDSTIAVIDSGSPTLMIIDARNGGLSQAAPRVVPLPDVPTRLELMDAPGVLACTRIGPGPLLLVDMRRDFASFFVPMN